LNWVLDGLRECFFRRDGMLRSGWWMAFYLLFYGLLLTPTGLFRMGEAAYRLASSAALILAAWPLLSLQKRPMRELGLRLDARGASEFGAGILGGALIMALAAVMAWSTGAFHWEQGLRPSASVLLPGLGLYLAVALEEELMFHGYLLRRVCEGLGRWPGLLLMAAAFAYAHWGNPGMADPATRAFAMANIALAGVLLGLCCLKTGGLACSIGIHLGWNFTQGNLLGFGVSGTTDTPGLLRPVFHGRPEWLTGGAFGLEASLPCLLVCGSAIVALTRWKGSLSPSPGQA
jgi:membrane protease YdiL (CAAX protease family)